MQFKYDKTGLRALQAQIIKLEEKLDSVETIQTANDELLDSIKFVLQAHKQELDLQTSILQGREAEHNKLLGVYEEAKEYTRSLETEHNKLLGVYEEAREYARSLEVALHDREDELASLKSTLQGREEEHHKLQDTYEEARDYASLLESTLQAREEELASVKAAAQEWEAEAVGLDQELQAIHGSRAWGVARKLQQLYQLLRRFTRGKPDTHRANK